MNKNQIIQVIKNLIYFLVICVYGFAIFYYNMPHLLSFLILVVISIIVAIIEKKSPIDVSKLTDFKFSRWLICVILTAFVSIIILALIPSSFALGVKLLLSLFIGFVIGTQLYFIFSTKKDKDSEGSETRNKIV